MKSNLVVPILILILVAGVTTSKAQILQKIETFKAPPYPKGEYVDMETYDYRIKSNTAVPPTFTDALICDIWQSISNRDLQIPIKQDLVNEEIINAVFLIYLYRGYEDIAGYRPWTHWNFIKNLTKDERAILATEIVAYIKKYGVKDVD